MNEIVRIGNATLHHADCRDVLPTLGKFDLLLTDPPYGIGFAKKTSDFRGSKFFDHGESLRSDTVYSDDPLAIAGLIREVVPIALTISERAVIFCGPAMLWQYPEPAALGCVYMPNGAGRCAWGFQCSQPILFFGKDIYLQDGKGGRANSFRTEQPNREVIDHPCPKPVSWMLWATERASRAGEAVLDPFMGSGTTGVACIQSGRAFTGIERERKYFDISCERIERAHAQGQLFAPAIEKPEQQEIAA